MFSHQGLQGPIQLYYIIYLTIPPPHSASCPGASAVFAASCCVGHICLVGGGGGYSCMLLLHPVPTSSDAVHDLCTLCPDLWTLCLWCFPSFNWCKHSTCTGGGCHQLQLALVVHFHSATSADSPLAHVVASPSATCAGVAFSSSHWRKYCTCTWATCTVWWWSVVYICIYIGERTFLYTLCMTGYRGVAS